jgi:hypothetical protein
MSAPTVHRIDDFARPRLPWPVRAANTLARPLSGWLGRVAVDELMSTACKRTGLSDFGDDAFREPLAVLTGAIARETHLTPLGRVMARQFLLQLLGNRLRAEDLIRRNPQILDEEVRAPIFIVGLPRTGTTHLHNLVSQDPRLRSLPYWESLEPVPEVGRRGDPAADDPRMRRCDMALRFQHYVMPLFALMHEMTSKGPHEEIQLMAMDFSTMLFETMYQVPSYRDWYKHSNQTGPYRYLRRMLQMLQWLRGPKHWSLKSPQHLEQVAPILAAFPDASIVQTHRDPLRILASLCTMTAYSLRMQNDRIDPHAVGRYWSERLEDLLRAAVVQRALIPDDQVMDVHFHEFMADDVATAERVLDFAGQPVSAAAHAAIENYLAANPRGKHGTVVYDLRDFGIDADERRAALRFYQERFDVPDE